MLIAGQLLLSADANRAKLVEGWLRVEGGCIAELVHGPCPHTPDLGGEDCFITPGFIDTHVHLPQFDGIGCDGLPLLEWLGTHIFPMESLWEDAQYAAAMTGRVLAQFLAHGTTSFCAYATVHHEATLAAMELTHQLGLRACIGQSLMDRNSPHDLTRPAHELINDVRRLVDRYPPGSATSRVEFAVTPRFAGSCTPELMQAVAIIARASGAIVQTHLAETLSECEWIESLFDGQLYTAVYRSMGLLGKRTLLGHGIYLRDEERRLLRQSQSVIAHCPCANVFLQSGVMPRWLWKEEGLRISLGSDIGAGYEVSMPRVARGMIDAAKYLRLSNPACTAPTAAEAWHQITAGNADAAGWPQVGRLQTGAEADILVSWPGIVWRTSPDPLSMLLHAWDSRWIETVLVAGHPATL